MKAQIALRKILNDKFDEARAKNPQYSKRAFARRLGLSSGAITELFNGSRPVSSKLARKIADSLALDPQERSDLFALFPAKDEKTKKELLAERKSRYLKISADQFQIIADWYHFIILTLIDTLNFKSEVSWIAQRLNLPLGTTKKAIDRLIRLGYITENENGQLTRATPELRSPDDTDLIRSAMLKAHRQVLQKADEALGKYNFKIRDYTALTLTMSPSQLPRAKEMIRKFQDELSAEIEKEKGSEVFQLSVQFFPLTNIDHEDYLK